MKNIQKERMRKKKQDEKKYKQVICDYEVFNQAKPILLIKSNNITNDKYESIC